MDAKIVRVSSTALVLVARSATDTVLATVSYLQITTVPRSLTFPPSIRVCPAHLSKMFLQKRFILLHRLPKAAW